MQKQLNSNLMHQSNVDAKKLPDQPVVPELLQSRHAS